MESTGDHQETRKDPCRDLELEFFLIPLLFFPLPSPDLPLCRGQLCSKGMVPFLRSKTAFFLLNPRQKQHLTGAGSSLDPSSCSSEPGAWQEQANPSSSGLWNINGKGSPGPLPCSCPSSARGVFPLCSEG